MMLKKLQDLGRLGWLALGAVAVLGCSPAGDGGDDNGGAGTGNMPVTATPPTGPCTPGQSGMCTGGTCSNGSAPTAECLPSATYAPTCTCPAPTNMPTGGGGTTAAGNGAGTGTAGSAGVTPAGTGGGGGTMAGSSSGAGGGGGGGAGGGEPPVGENAWKQMAFDVKGTYHNPYETTLSVENAAMITEKWVFPVAGVPHGGVLVVDGKVFATSSAGVYAINLADGTEAWAKTDLEGQNTLAFEDGFLYLHTYTGGNLWKLNASDGIAVWGPKPTNPGAGADGTSSPIVAGGKVIVGHATSLEIGGAAADLANARGGVVAFDTETGNEAWRYYTTELPENGAMVWSSVTVDEETGIVFAATGNNYTMTGANSDAIHAIDLATGDGLWVSQVREGDLWNLGMGVGQMQDTDFGANPILAESAGRKLVAAGDKGSAFWALDRMTGDIVWSKPDLTASHDEGHGGVLNNGAYDGERFYVVSNAPAQGRVSMLHAFNADGTVAWPAKMLADINWGMLSVANGVLAVPVNTQLHLYNAATGDLLKMFDTGGTIAAGAAAIAEGHIVVKSGLSYPIDTTLSATANNEIHCYGLP